MKQLFILAFTIFFITGFATPADINPGIDRWKIKTSLKTNAEHKTSTLKKLLALANPFTDADNITCQDSKYDTERFKKEVSGFKEGDIVTVKGWIHLVALENDSKYHRDGDYHIQMRTSKQWGDTCFIVEIPMGEFASNESLKNKFEASRKFVRDRLLKGNEPGTNGNKMQHEVYVTVTGQLFFDLIHSCGNPRGKKGMKSYSCWELHPVTDIAFAIKPH